MPRRTGKAATRRARQQRRTRQGPAPSAAAPATQPSAAPPAAVQPTADASAARRPTAPSFAAASTSRLGEGAREEYHYVMRDLRNTGILVLVMTALLAAAVVIVNVSGIAPS